MNWQEFLAESVNVILFTFFGLVFPQLLGITGYRWARNKRNLFKAMTLLIAPIAFFVIIRLFWWMQVEAINKAGHRVCGAMGAADVFSTIWGTIIHLVVACIFFAGLTLFWKKHRNKEMPNHAQQDTR